MFHIMLVISYNDTSEILYRKEYHISVTGAQFSIKGICQLWFLNILKLKKEKEQLMYT